MKELIEREFGFDVLEVKKLSGYDNVNYLIKTDDAAFIFKTYTCEKELLDILQTEKELLHFLRRESKQNFPYPIPFTDGEFIKVLDIQGNSTICRLLSFLDGDFMGDVKPTPELVSSLGTFLAELDTHLQRFNSYILKARQWEWDIQYLHLNRKYLDDISDPHDRNVVQYFFQQFEENVRPILPELRKQVIYNDANEWNILLKEGEVSGLIDFGDLAYSPVINEVAVALTYLCYDKEEPLEWLPAFLTAYQAILPLEETEISVLYYLIAARLCISVCNSAHARKASPDNAYATVSETCAWKMLYKWLATGPIAAEKVFRQSVGMPVEAVENTGEAIEKKTPTPQPDSVAKLRQAYLDGTRGISVYVR